MTQVVFAAAAIAAIVSSVGVIMSRNPVHAALNLVGTLFAVAVMFVLQEAHFLAAVQVIVYAGAIVILFLFVIMLLGVDRSEILDETLPVQRPAAIASAVVAGFGLVFLVTGTVATGQLSARGPAVSGEGGNVERLGESLFTDFIWPFEVTAALLVIAVVGAIVLVRERQQGEGGSVGDEAMRQARAARAAVPQVSEPGEAGETAEPGDTAEAGDTAEPGDTAEAGDTPQREEGEEQEGGTP